MDRQENTFVIEACENCKSHNWNTRHDENKYKNYAIERKGRFILHSIVATLIQKSAPGTVVLINEVPKPWVDYEIYCQLIPNTDPSLKTYKILPRIGSFEVSFKGVVRQQKLNLFLVDILETSFGNVAPP